MKWLDRLLRRAAKPAPAPAPPPQERRSEPDPEALAAAADPPARVGLDLERLKELPSADYKPLTEYLTYIQVKRGETQSLIFVRQRDLETLAEMTGESKENFVKEFKRLGVLLSMN
ncbi:MAG: hypothetical protein M3164_04765 [Actinomycetota bacterium]|nr:hypothetical protein [Actinomycetota bacterium]